MRRLILIAISFVFAFNGVIKAQEGNTQKKKLMPRPPIYGIPAKTLPQGKFIYRSYFSYSAYSEMLNNGQMVDLPGGMTFNTLGYTPKLRYGLTNRLTLIANFPLYYKKMSFNNKTKTGIGLGDVILAGLYRFYFNKEKRFLVSGLVFTKSPTGKSTNLDSDELPLGTGSFDAGIALLPEKEIGKFDFRASAFYIRRGKNKANVDLGDVQSYSLSTAYNFSKKFIAEATILYKSTFENKFNGVTLQGTNTYMMQTVVGAEYRLAPTFLLQMAVPVTLSAKVPFASKYDFWLGIYYLI
jgi:hypothetical protein